MKIKSKSKFVVRLLLLIIIAVVIISFIVMVISSLTKNNNQPTGGPGGIVDNPSSQTDDNQGGKVDTDSMSYVYDNYKSVAKEIHHIEKDNMTAPDGVTVNNFDIAVIDDKMNVVMMNITNNGSGSIAPGTVYSITFYDDQGVKNESFGGIVEGEDPIEVGQTTVIRAQFIGKLRAKVAKVVIDINK